MPNRTPNQLNRNQDYIVGVVTVVDMSTNKILVQDRFGTDFQISLHLLDPSLLIPQVGEGWLIRRIGFDWFLDKRIETGTETTAITSLMPGDRRIEGNVIHINGDLNFSTQATSSILSILPDGIYRSTFERFISAEGFIAETLDRRYTSAQAANTGTPSAGVVFLQAGKVASQLTIACTNAGSSLTLYRVGLYNSSLNLVASSNDNKANITNSWVTTPFTTSYAVPADDWYYPAIVVRTNGTFPNMLAASSFGYATQPLGIGPYLGWVDSVNLDLANTVTNPAGQSRTFWMGLS